MVNNYGVFIVTRCPVCGRRRSQPMYQGEQLVLRECEHNPSALPVPEEIVLQRVPPYDGQRVLAFCIVNGGDSHGDYRLDHHSGAQ